MVENPCILLARRKASGLICILLIYIVLGPMGPDQDMITVDFFGAIWRECLGVVQVGVEQWNVRRQQPICGGGGLPGILLPETRCLT